ncbi:MAG: hypothetical protein JHD35_14915 [Sphingopyxis sp.]|nr:hypothetical protein [Sphingopyxis sp.]
MQLLERPLLTDRLLSFPDGNVIALQAPAGFGKTSLLKALKNRARSVFADEILGGYTADDVRTAALESLRAKDVGATERPHWILIDDADDAPVSWLESINALICQKRLEGIRVVVATRRLRDLPFARLRAHGRLQVLDATQLRFSAREAQSLYAQAVGPKRAQKLWESCAGWPAAMNLLGEWLTQPGSDLDGGSSFMRLSGLSDYIEQEILHSLDDEARLALVFASMVSPINREILDAIGGDRDLGRLLRPIGERLHGLVHDAHGNVTLNPLLSAYCAQEFDMMERGAREKAIAKASQACMSASRIAEATALIERSSEDNAIVEYVRRSQGLRLWVIAGFDVIRTLINRARPETIASEPRLKLLKCIVHLKEGQIADAEALFSETLPILPDEEAAHIDAAVVRATLQIYGCRPSTSKSLRPLQSLIKNSDDPAWKALITTIQCISNGQMGRFDEAVANAAEAEIHARTLGSEYNFMFLEFHMTSIAIARGELANGRASLSRARKRWSQRYRDDIGVETVMNALRANVEFEAGHITSARACLRKSAARMPHSEAWFDIYAAAYEPMARLMVEEAGLTSTLATLSSLRAELSIQGLHRVATFLHALSICLTCEAILQGRANREDFEHLHFSDDAYDTPVVTWQEQEIFALASAYCDLAEGNFQLAIDLLLPVLQSARRLGIRRTELRALLLLVEAYDRSGDAVQADGSFEAALTLAADTGMARILYELGGAALRERITLAIADVAATPTADPSRGRILSSISRWTNANAQQGQTLMLTAREQDVLGALSEGGSDKIIGRRLGVSEHAVRFHLKSIFRKLEVHDRVAALSRARTLGMLA